MLKFNAMASIESVFNNLSVSRYVSARPLLWYGRQVSAIFKDPFPSSAFEAVVRLVSGVATLIFPTLLLVLVPYGCIRLATKYFNHEQLPPQIQPPAEPLPQPTPEQVTEARERAESLKKMYEEIRDWNGQEATALFEGISKFQSDYRQYRDPNPMNVGEMTKIFNTMDEIAKNMSGVNVFLQQWKDFYRNSADAEGVIEMLKDGNCWLHTAIQGLKHINHEKLRDYTYITLREPVIDWICSQYDSDRTLQRYISSSIEAHKSVHRQRLEDEKKSLNLMAEQGMAPEDQVQSSRALLDQQIADLEKFSRDDYYANMRKLGSHGSHAELYAISRIFQVNVNVWRDVPACIERPRRLTQEYDEQILFPGAEHTINAVLTREGNHLNYRLP